MNGTMKGKKSDTKSAPFVWEDRLQDAFYSYREANKSTYTELSKIRQCGHCIGRKTAVKKKAELVNIKTSEHKN